MDQKWFSWPEIFWNNGYTKTKKAQEKCQRRKNACKIAFISVNFIKIYLIKLGLKSSQRIDIWTSTIISEKQT